MEGKTWGGFYKGRTGDSWSDFLRVAGANATFIEYITGLRSRKVMELGCGPAQVSVFLSYLGFEVTAFDKDEAVLQYARGNNERFLGHVKFLSGDAFHLPFHDDEFDVVFNQGFFEHFSDENIRAIIGESLRVAPNLIFSVPNANYPRQDFGDERLMTKRQWEEILSPFNLVLSLEEGKQTTWETPAQRVVGMFNSFVLKRDIRKPRVYVAAIKR